MIPIVVLIVCKSSMLPASEQDPNSKWTGVEAREWVIEHSQMQCRRIEVPLYDPAAGQGAPDRPFTPNDCQKAGLMAGIGWDMAHKSSKYRYWRSACPVPIVDTRTGKILDWKLPECPRMNRQERVSVHCDVDIGI